MFKLCTLLLALTLSAVTVLISGVKEANVYEFTQQDASSNAQTHAEPAGSGESGANGEHDGRNDDLAAGVVTGGFRGEDGDNSLSAERGGQRNETQTAVEDTVFQYEAGEADRARQTVTDGDAEGGLPGNGAGDLSTGSDVQGEWGGQTTINDSLSPTAAGGLSGERTAGTPQLTPSPASLEYMGDIGLPATNADRAGIIAGETDVAQIRGMVDGSAAPEAILLVVLAILPCLAAIRLLRNRQDDV